MYFRAGCSWQDDATLCCEVYWALLVQTTPCGCYKDPLLVDELQKYVPSSGLAPELGRKVVAGFQTPCHPQLGPFVEGTTSVIVHGGSVKLLLQVCFPFTHEEAKS